MSDKKVEFAREIPARMPEPPVAAALEQSILDRIVEEQARSRATIAERYRPVFNNEELMAREQAIAFLVEKIMREGVDYGWVPGTRPKEDAKPGEYQAKPTLFKAGAERACSFFGYVPVYEELEVIEAWTPEDYGEMLFYYKYRCTLKKDGHAIGEGIGAATTWESKYRYRNTDRVCPACGAASIIKGRAEYGGGWLCFAKKGGCGAKYSDLDPAVTEQQIGKVPNPDVADVINTVQKMGQKRAYVAATLTATGLSGRFAQDLEDIAPATTDEPKRNTQAEQDRLAAERIAAERAKAEQQAQERADEAANQDPITQFERYFAAADRFKRLEAFQSFKMRFATLLGAEAGEAKYRDFLQAAGVQKSDQFKSLGDARRCGVAMLKALITLEEQAAAKQETLPTEDEPAGAGVIGDDDIPANMGGTFDSGEVPTAAGRIPNK